MNLPDKLELMYFFESEPTDYSDQGEPSITGYEFADSRGLAVQFLIDDVAETITTTLMLGANQVASIYQEGGKEISIVSTPLLEYLHCSFETDGTSSECRIYLKPTIRVEWSTLIV